MTCLNVCLLGMHSKFITSETLEILASNESFGIEVGIPTTSKHSRLEYWELAQHCRSVSISWLTFIINSFLLTFFTIATSASTFFICTARSLISDVSSFISEFISNSSCKTSLIRLGLFKPFNIASVWTNAIQTFQKTQKILC